MPTANEDDKLVQRLVKGDPYSFDQIFSRYNKKVYAFSFRNLKNKEDAEGVVQEVFASLWKDRAKLERIRNLDAWIFTICFNTIKKYFRQSIREKKHLREFVARSLEDDHTTGTEVEYYDLLERAEKIIGRLPLRQKTIFLLSRKEGLSNEEISVKLNITKKTVENHLSNAKVLIRKAIIDEGLLSFLFFWLFVK